MSPHEVRLDKYGWTVNRDNVKAIIEQIADYPEIVAAANLLAQPTADEAEGDEREVLAAVLDPRRWESVDSHPEFTERIRVKLLGWSLEAADRALAAGFHRRAGLRERVEALDLSCENYDEPGQDCITAGREVFAAEGCTPCRVRATLAADTPASAPEGSGRAS